MDNLFRIALEQLPNPTLIVASNRKLLFANIAAINIFDIAIGKDLALTIRHPNILYAVDQTLASQTTKRLEFQIPSPLTQIFELHSVPISHTPGAQFVLLSLQDKTKAAHSEEIRADFVANASHKLRSPLSAILSFIETLQGPASGDAEARVRFLDIMGREAGRMSRLIDDLLQLSRVEMDEHIRPIESVNIGASIRYIFQLLESWAILKGMTLDLIGAERPIVIEGDCDQLNQIFRDLIENVIHYGKSDSVVQVIIEQHNTLPNTPANGITIHIKDSSNGIGKRYIPRLTERFYRIDNTRTHLAKNTPKSTGLGLAIVKHIVNRHRGRLKVENEVGVGSTFSVYLPN